MSHSQGNRGLLIALFLLIFPIYLASYSGRIESGDSLRVIDAASSLVHFHDTLRDETVWEEPPLSFEADVSYPFLQFDPSQNLIVYLASVPYTLASLLPEIGLVHATWLLNIVIVSLTILVFYQFARAWGYEERVALLASLILGLGTILWPYSKTLFREPLVMLLLLFTALMLEKWRGDYRKFWWLLLAVVAMVAANFAKNSSIFAIPAFIILALPKMKYPKLGNILAVVSLLLLLVFAFVPNTFEPLQEVLRPIRRFNVEYSQIALQAYLFSIGGSLWATSPVLLLGLFGAGLYFRQGERQRVYWVLGLIGFYSFAHALFTDVHWFGGLSWPPRFLVPVVPFAALLLLPVLQWLMQPNHMLWRLLALLLLAYSIGIQLIASISWQDSYVGFLPAKSGGLVEWSGGLHNPAYLRWLLIPQSWNALGFDIAWTRSGAAYFIWIFLGLALAAAFLIWQRRYRWLLIALALVNCAVLYMSLRYLYANDPQYWAHKPALFDMLAILQAESANGEPLLLAGGADITYERFIMNYNRLSSIRPVVLGFQDGELTGPDDNPDILFRDTISVTELFDWDVPRIIDILANRHERIWWLGHNSEFTPWAVRVEQRYLVENYYLLREVKSEDPTVRLLEFSTVRAPNPYDFRLPEHASDLRFGENIRLNGFTLPLGTQYAAEDVVPISFFWETDEVLSIDYTIAWFIANEAGVLRNGHDSQPKDGFALTQSWLPNVFVIDNRAIELPADAPAGTYQIWLRVYVTGTGGADALPITAGEAREDNLGILPIQLVIR
jgi:hypothetical protein